MCCHHGSTLMPMGRKVPQRTSWCTDYYEMSQSNRINAQHIHYQSGAGLQRTEWAHCQVPAPSVPLFLQRRECSVTFALLPGPVISVQSKIFVIQVKLCTHKFICTLMIMDPFHYVTVLVIQLSGCKLWRWIDAGLSLLTVCCVCGYYDAGLCGSINTHKAVSVHTR